MPSLRCLVCHPPHCQKRFSLSARVLKASHQLTFCLTLTKHLQSLALDAAFDILAFLVRVVDAQSVAEDVVHRRSMGVFNFVRARPTDPVFLGMQL